MRFMPVHRLLRTARQRAGLSVRALAGRAGTSHATLLAYESGRKVPRADTMLRILRAAGFDTELAAAPRAEHDPAARRAKGDELAAVLELAAAFPARHSRNMPYPRFR